MQIDGVKITERGWAGHFIAADQCRFRRNTLLEYGDKKWIVSTVGAMPQSRIVAEYPELRSENGMDTIGWKRYYETMAFEAKPVKDDKSNVVYWDADVGAQIDFDSDWAIADYNFETDKQANEMHDKVVEELIKKIKG